MDGVLFAIQLSLVVVIGATGAVLVAGLPAILALAAAGFCVWALFAVLAALSG